MEGTARAGQGGLMGSDIPAMPRGCSGTGGCRELLLLPQSSASCPHSGGCSPSTLPSPFCWRDVCQVDTTGVVPQSASGTPEWLWELLLLTAPQGWGFSKLPCKNLCSQVSEHVQQVRSPLCWLSDAACPLVLSPLLRGSSGIRYPLAFQMCPLPAVACPCLPVPAPEKVL